MPNNNEYDLFHAFICSAANESMGRLRRLSLLMHAPGQQQPSQSRAQYRTVPDMYYKRMSRFKYVEMYGKYLLELFFSALY